MKFYERAVWYASGIGLLVGIVGVLSAWIIGTSFSEPYDLLSLTILKVTCTVMAVCIVCQWFFIYKDLTK